MKLYNKRTWLNNIESSSTSNVVAFDGDVGYSDKTYRDTFFKISDCKDSIKLHKKDTESMEYFVTKLELLKTEIQLFINHLKGKTMKITEFKKGDLITRVKVSEEYTSESKYELEPFLFSEISQGKIWLIHFNEHKGYEPEIFSEVFEKRKDDDWEYYVIPDILKDLLLEQMGKSKLLLCKLLRKYLIKNNLSSYRSK